MATAIPPQVLNELRLFEPLKAGRFVDPLVMHECEQAMRRRGLRWTEAVVGRPLSRRSLLRPDLPWLVDGEPYIITAADSLEDAWGAGQ